MANPLQPLLLHESQQTTPRPHTHHRHIQTDIHAIVQLPSFAGIMPTPEANQPDSSLPTTSMAPTASPNPTSAANKQPHDRWQYVNLIPTPTVIPCRNNHTHHRHFLPPSGAHRATDAPRHLHAPPPPPALGSRTHAPVPPLHIAQHQPPLHSRTMLQSTLFQNDPRHHFIKPNNLPPPLNRCSPSLRLLAGHVSKADHILPPHQRHPWPAHYQVPTQQQHPPIPIQVSSAALAPPSPVVMLHPPTTRVDQQGRALPQSQQDYDPRTDPWHADNH